MLPVLLAVLLHASNNLLLASGLCIESSGMKQHHLPFCFIAGKIAGRLINKNFVEIDSDITLGKAQVSLQVTCIL